MQLHYTTECGSGNGSKDVIRALKEEIREDRARLDSPMIVRFDESGEHDFSACASPARLLEAFDPEEVEFLPGFTPEERCLSLELWERKSKKDILRGLSMLGCRRGAEKVRSLVAAQLAQIESLFHGSEPIEHNRKAKVAHYVKLAKDLRDEISRMGNNPGKVARTMAPTIPTVAIYSRAKEYRSPSRRSSSASSSGSGGGGDSGDDPGGSDQPEPPASFVVPFPCDILSQNTHHAIAHGSQEGRRC
jgi:hypothetical protein